MRCCDNFFPPKRLAALRQLRRPKMSIFYLKMGQNRCRKSAGKNRLGTAFFLPKAVATAEKSCPLPDSRCICNSPCNRRTCAHKNLWLQLGIPIRNFRLISTRTSSIDLLHSGLGVLQQVLANEMWPRVPLARPRRPPSLVASAPAPPARVRPRSTREAGRA